MRRIELVYFNAGGGHRAAARALHAALSDRHSDWELRVVNLFEALDPQGQFRRLTGIDPEDYYNLRLKKGWTAGLAKELKVLQAGIRMAHAFMLRRLIPHWLDAAPDLVVSLIPNFNRVLSESLRLAWPEVPYLTVMTDLADYPPSFWIEPDSHQHIACGTDHALDQARSMGLPMERIHRMSGMLLHPDFYQPVQTDIGAEREALGLDPHRPTGVVMFGGHGAPAMETIAQKLGDVQLVLMSGQNEKLAARLQRARMGAPRAVIGYTQNVRKYLRLGDFFVGKPGPGSLSEALHLGLPVITIRNAWTMPQERYNTDWITASGTGKVIASARAIGPAVRDLLRDIEFYRANVRQVRNHAVFDVVDTIETLLTAKRDLRGRPYVGLARTA